MGVPNVLNAELQRFMEAELCFVLVRPLMDLSHHHSHSYCGNFSQFKCIYIVVSTTIVLGGSMET